MSHTHSVVGMLSAGTRSRGRVDVARAPLRVSRYRLLGLNSATPCQRDMACT